MQFRLLDILQSTGPIALNELIMRTHPGQSPEDLKELVEQLKPWSMRASLMFPVCGRSIPQK
jgi:hypothetical protein